MDARDQIWIRDVRVGFREGPRCNQRIARCSSVFVRDPFFVRVGWPVVDVVLLLRVGSVVGRVLLTVALLEG
jgi:hypothetical protein